MSDDAMRPRRARASDDTADGSGLDSGRDDNPFARPARSADTPARSAVSPDYHSGSPDDPPVSPARRSLDSPYEAAHEQGSTGIGTPTRGLDFARHDVPPPAASPASPAPAGDTLIPAPILPPRGEGFYEGPGPQPRRSALSSVTPPEPPPPTPEKGPRWEPAAAAGSPAASAPTPAPTPSPHTTPERQPSPPTAAGGAPTGAPDWWRAHARAFAVAGLGIAVLAVGAGIVGFLTGGPSAPVASPSPSVSPSVSPTIPRVDVADLLTEADAKALNPNATWAITNTTTAAGEHAARPACFSTEPSASERLDSVQRTLGTTEDNQLAVLHQLDAYPSVEAAQTALTERAGRMAACDEVPMRIISAENVEGLGEESYQVTVLHEGEQPQHHNLLLTRVGNILSITDAFSNDAAIATDLVIEAGQRSLDGLCERVGTCGDAEVAITPTAVPPVEPHGWLVVSDLPRMRAGFGRWTAQTPTALTSRGNGCEDMTLASASGPSDHLQNTYLVTQDDQAPDQFGLDEMVFVFGEAGAASTFATDLGENLATCAERVLGTEVSIVETAEGIVAYDITREIEDGEIAYQVAVVAEGARVAYLMATVTEDYRFDDASLGWVAERAGVRLTQA
ncbi:MAG: hypothetical protein GX596_00180 [Propionibacterium sp.]|nr:hypothetical protein [Propionibacterium sp.]